jgi:hypothetical protein
MSPYRSASEFREILRILQRASAMQENLMWQTEAAGRNIIPIHHFEIDFVAREVVIFFDVKLYRVKESLPLYLKLEYRGSVFKIMNFRINQESVSFPFPAEIKTRELRHALRYQLTGNKEKFVILKPISRTDNATEIKVRAQDISQHGIGLIVSEQNRSFIKNNRIIWVTKLQDIELATPILAEVVYLNSEVDPKVANPNKKVKELKVGLKLSGTIPQDVLNEFVS